MSKKRQAPAKTLADNLNKLMIQTGWSNRHLAELSGVSDRYIGMIRKGDYKATVDIAEALGKPFGLTGWQMIVPNIDLAAVRNGRLTRLVQNYLNSPEASRAYIDSVAARDAKYPPQHDESSSPDASPDTRDPQAGEAPNPRPSVNRNH